MARIPLVERESAPQEIRDAYERLRASYDLPDVFRSTKVLAHAPNLMPLVLALAEGILRASGSLDPRLRHLISIRVSRVNACRY